MVELNQIKKWDYTFDRSSYIGLDGKLHSYLLDFKVWRNDDTFYYIETKGYKKDVDELKWKSVRDRGIELIVWYLRDIKSVEKNLMVSFV